jgi:hypothetical protein
VQRFLKGWIPLYGNNKNTMNSKEKLIPCKSWSHLKKIYSFITGSTRLVVGTPC